jgi:hypothetical protein
MYDPFEILEDQLVRAAVRQQLRPVSLRRHRGLRRLRGKALLAVAVPICLVAAAGGAAAAGVGLTIGDITVLPWGTNDPTMPASLYAGLASPTPGSPLATIGPDPARAVYIGTTAGHDVWLVPATDGACIEVLFESGGSYNGSVGGCGGTQDIEAGKEVLTNTSGSGFIVGIAPAGVQSVQLTAANDTSETIPVTDSVWSLATLNGLSGEQTSLTFTFANGRTQTTQMGVIP